MYMHMGVWYVYAINLYIHTHIYAYIHAPTYVVDICLDAFLTNIQITQYLAEQKLNKNFKYMSD